MSYRRGKEALKLKERKERWKIFSFFKGTDTSAASSKWNPFKFKGTPLPLPAFDEEDTSRAIEDQQKKVPLMKKISQTFEVSNL